MQRSVEIFNFNAGPAMLPVEVMERAQKEFLDYKGSKMSVMEISHRGKDFLEILENAEKNLRELLSIPEHYSIAFFPGGATLQFSGVPLNLLEENEKGIYSLTGIWAVKAYEEAKKLGYNVDIYFDGKYDKYIHIPSEFNTELLSKYKYFYITSNNTIYGSRYTHFPSSKSVNLVADMTSDLLSRKIDISNFAYIFAGAQKNIGPSGLTIGIIRNDLLDIIKRQVPILLDYKIYFKNKSLYNTPPTYSIYIAGLVFEWCKTMGGIEKIEAINEKKAKLLYDYIDSSNLYFAPISKDSRSIMNVVFHLKDKSLEKKFTDESELNGLYGLVGHRDAGGFRASIYNAMPLRGVEKLLDFLKEFENKS